LSQSSHLDILKSLYRAAGEEFLVKIAVELERALAQRLRDGAPGGTSVGAVAQGEGWTVSDLLCTCGPRDHPVEERQANFYIAIVAEGSFQYRSGLGRALMTPGSLVLGNAGQCFACGHEHGTGDRCLSFGYTPEYFERLAADAGIPGPRLEFRVPRLPALRALSPVVAPALASLGGSGVARWEELGLELAARALRLASEGRWREDGDAAPSAVARVTRVVRMMEQHPSVGDVGGRELTLGRMAGEAGLSPYHFLRTFERLTGLTPYQYVRRLRLREAARRLTTEPAKILDVAFDCGFGDVSNFNHAFRAEFGVSPRAYRRNKVR
jgi:AraC family transcriptional regulator